MNAQIIRTQRNSADPSASLSEIKKTFLFFRIFVAGMSTMLFMSPDEHPPQSPFSKGGFLMLNELV